jgi:chromosome segregation ATPase
LEKLKKVKQENEDLKAKNQELTEKLKQKSELCQDQMQKSQEALKKLEETIEVAENSMSEIHKLIYEKEQIEEEYNNLAQTIGAVLEETAQKVDREMELQNAKHQEKILKLEQEILRYQKLLEEETSKTQNILSKNQMLSKTNSFLDHDLKIAFNVVDEAEKKLRILEKSIEVEQKNSKLCEEEAEHLKFIIQKKNQYKQVYHGMLLEILGMMEKLLAENKRLKGLK